MVRAVSSGVTSWSLVAEVSLLALGMSLTGVTLTLTVAVAVPPLPSLTV